MIKRFLEWIGLKEKLNKQNHEPPLFKENEVWWCYIGENVGNEINGKSEKFTRPIFIFKKYDRYTFFGLPLTSKKKVGSWYVPISFLNTSQTVVLSQSRIFDYRRLDKKIGELTLGEGVFIREEFTHLHMTS